MQKKKLKISGIAVHVCNMFWIRTRSWQLEDLEESLCRGNFQTGDNGGDKRIKDELLSQFNYEK
jgi:hypothetical protein